MADNLEGYDYQFVDPGHTDDQKCPICHLVVRDAHQVTCCGKLLCERCLTKRRNGSGKCPICRGNIKNAYFQDKRTDRKIKSLQVYCSYKDAGCKWIGELRGVEEHIVKDCNYQTVECPDCKNTMMKHKFAKHRSDECLLREYKCPLCKKEGTYQFITTADHQNTCPEVELKCKNTGCNEHFKRCKMSSHTEVCPKQVINCPFNDMGCKVTPTRENQQTHWKDDVVSHVDLLARHMNVMSGKIDKMSGKMDEMSGKMDEMSGKMDEMSGKMASDNNMMSGKTNEISGKIDKMARNGNMMSEKIDKMAKEVQVYHRDIVPMLMKFTGFSFGKENNEDWFSEGFYTGIGGYKVRLIISPNGFGVAKSTHLSVFVNLMPGVNDDTLEFPLRGTFTIALLNQLEDKSHYTESIDFDEHASKKNSCRKYKLDDQGRGCHEFISHFSLVFNQDRNTKYLHNDTVYFRVTAEVSSNTKSWLAVM